MPELLSPLILLPSVSLVLAGLPFVAGLTLVLGTGLTRTLGTGLTLDAALVVLTGLVVADGFCSDRELLAGVFVPSKAKDDGCLTPRLVERAGVADFRLDNPD